VTELLLEVRTEVCDGLNILGLSFLPEILTHLVLIEFWDDVSAIIDNVICVVCNLWVSGVVTVMLSKVSKNCA
jgi:hypothetical protein